MNDPVGSPEQHYETLLAAHYSWMFGDFEAAVDRQTAIFHGLGIEDGAGKRAVDLGSGSGFQSIALARMGFQVTAVDTSEVLLDELKARAGTLDITCEQADLRALSTTLISTADLVVCMGDTLPHLGSKDEIGALFQGLAAHSPLGAELILSFRDLKSELTGTDRFIPLRSAEDRIMTCFLEYEPETVIVTDLVHVRGEDGWQLHKSRYRKVRLGKDDVSALLADAGFIVEHESAEAGFIVIKAYAPS